MKSTVRRDGPQEPPKIRSSPFDSEILLQNFIAQNNRWIRAIVHPGLWSLLGLDMKPLTRRKADQPQARSPATAIIW
ncbi:hypothetical protein CKAH01_02878 [Colletotrichum kahawae]|uniref:Uncharacterized protein n=1 Tax=Colletotrichum kahawae TaxID=34407 RepID=A0AAD9XWR7_COLKA|nr:hypothetical protein CKAH01_02878 [Colletotrichum kahawae]